MMSNATAYLGIALHYGVGRILSKTIPTILSDLSVPTSYHKRHSAPDAHAAGHVAEENCGRNYATRERGSCSPTDSFPRSWQEGLRPKRGSVFLFADSCV